MIVDSQSIMVSNHTSDNPPSYEFLTAQTTNPNEQPLPISDKGARPVRQPSTPPVLAVHNRPAPMTQQPVVYHYQNPTTGEHLASLLPPDHPEMVCVQQGGHLNETKFGILGILAAIVWFPLGIGLCLLDRRVKCKRCGTIIQDRICG